MLPELGSGVKKLSLLESKISNELRVCELVIACVCVGLTREARRFELGAQPDG
jgi:hypothetical protein